MRRPLPRTAATVVAALAALAVGLLAAPVPVEASGHTAERSFEEPEAVVGSEVTVTVEAGDYGDFGRVTETLPEGWTYTGSSLPDAAVSIDGRDVRFLLLDETTFTYTVTAPEAAGAYTFSGVIEDASRRAAPVGGDQAITVRSLWAHCLKGAVAESFSLVVYEGGALEELANCAESRGLTTLYALHEGAYLAYALGAPAFVNRDFTELFADGVPELTPLIAKSDGPPSDDPVGDIAAPGDWPTCLHGEVGAGFSAVVYAGGSVEELAACASSLAVTSLYALHEGEWEPYIVGAPTFVNRDFGELFTGVVPALTPFIVKGAEPAPAGPAEAAGSSSPAESTVEPDDQAPARSSASGQSATVEQRRVRVIAGTGGIGVSHRNDCVDGARLHGFGWADGELVEVVAEGDGRCAGWLQVRAGGVTSWVRERYLLAA